jgi:MFS family permease
VGVISDELQSSKEAMANVFANRAMRKIFMAFGGSLIGDGVFALSALVYAYRHGGPATVGALAVARYVAIASTATFTSTLADRYDRRFVMVGCDIVRLMLVTTAAVLAGVHASKWYIFVLVVLIGIAGTAFRPAQASILPLLAREPDEIAGANVVSSTIESVGFFAGPALAGFLLAFANVPVAFGFDALTFVWSALFVLSVRYPTPEEKSDSLSAREVNEAEEVATESFLSRAAQGFRVILGNHDVRTLVVLYILQCVVAGASAVFTVAIALHLLHIGSSGLGLMESTIGIGGLLGGFVALMLMERARLATNFGLGVMVWAAPLILIAALPNLGSALIAMCLIGIANSVVDVNAITVLQHVVPNEKLGRVLGALEAGEVAGMALGSLAMTVLIEVTGLRDGLALIGGIVTLAVLPGLRTMKRIDREVFSEGLKHRPKSAHGHLHFHNHRLRHSR